MPPEVPIFFYFLGPDHQFDATLWWTTSSLGPSEKKKNIGTSFALAAAARISFFLDSGLNKFLFILCIYMCEPRILRKEMREPPEVPLLYFLFPGPDHQNDAISWWPSVSLALRKEKNKELRGRHYFLCFLLDRTNILLPHERCTACSPVLNKKQKIGALRSHFLFPLPGQSHYRSLDSWPGKERKWVNGSSLMAWHRYAYKSLNNGPLFLCSLCILGGP